MKIVLSLFLSIISFSVFAQIVSYPLEENQRLQIQEQERLVSFQQSFPDYASEQAQPREVSCLDFNSINDFYTQSQTVFVAPNAELRICLDTVALATFDCIGCDELNFGSAQIEKPCLIYSADNITEAGVDALIIQRCDDENFCIDLTFEIVIARQGTTITEPPTVVQPGTDIELCATLLDLPGEIDGSDIIFCNNDDLGTIRNGNFFDECVLFSSSRFAQADEICLKVCDDFCVCDTVIFPIIPLGDTLQLPFFDDFSYEGPYPNGSLWLDDNVFVNSTLTYRPPSIGAATFDGLSQAGVAYRGGYGASDRLTSAYLDLSNAGDNLVLSCFVQPKGLGYYPNEGDSLVLEFKNVDNLWERIHTWNGFENSIPLDSLPPFEFYSTEITGSDYRFNGFQFRFTNYSNRQGIDDLWHLDYVFLDDNYIPDGSFSDVAFTVNTNDVLDRYSAMPFPHFKANAANEVGDEINSGVRNLFDFAVSPADSEVRYIELISGSVLNAGNEFTVFDAPTFQADEFQDINRMVPGSAGDALRSGLTGLSGDEAVVQTEAFFTLDIQANNAFVNDTIRRITYLRDYYGYDDGTAERALSTVLPGQRVAVKFESTLTDTLRGVQLNLPPFAFTDMALFDLQIYIGDLDNEPEYEEAFLRPFYPGILYDTIQPVVTYRLNDLDGNPIGLEIPAGDFYIAIEQTSAQPTPIGFDINSTKGVGNQFVYNQIEWLELQDAGNVMIRALFSSETPVSTDVEDLEVPVQMVQLSPNPVGEQLYFNWQQDTQAASVQIYNLSGQQVWKGDQPQTIEVNNWTPGLYVVEIISIQGNRQVEKILIQR